MDIAIDFDGTCVEHMYPEVGKDIGAVPVLLDIVKSGHNLILFTLRSGESLKDAVKWFKKNNIPLYGIQTNPEQRSWTTSPKAQAQIYIDDAALGCPLLYGDYFEMGEGFYYHRPRVDWVKVRELLEQRGVITDKFKQ